MKKVEPNCNYKMFRNSVLIYTYGSKNEYYEKNAIYL